MTTDFRALCADLLEEITSIIDDPRSSWADGNRNIDNLIDRAIDALRCVRRPKPQSLKEQALEQALDALREAKAPGYLHVISLDRLVQLYHAIRYRPKHHSPRTGGGIT